MSNRSSSVDEAARRAGRHLGELVRDREQGRWSPSVVDLVRWGAVLGVDVPTRGYPAGSPLRDAGQRRTLAWTRTRIAGPWHWRTEVPVSLDRRDRRAVDAVISQGGVAIGLEIISRLTDAQAQVRRALLQQKSAGLNRMMLVLADTRRNRRALVDAAPTVLPASPLGSHQVLRNLRVGQAPPANGIAVV